MGKIIIGADHAGLDLKNHLVNWLKAQGYECHDVGTHETSSVDYPDYAKTVAQAVSRGDYSRGLLVCGSGLGMAIAANKVSGIRAITAYDPIVARLSREHNDANVLALGGRLTPPMVAEEIVSIWLKTPFAGSRHQGRIDKIHQGEKGMC